MAAGRVGPLGRRRRQSAQPFTLHTAALLAWGLLAITAMNIIRRAEFARFLEQVRDPQRRTWIMMNPTSIGDTAMACSLAREFVKQHGHGITMVVPPDHLPILQLFQRRFLRVVSADRSTMLNVMNNYIDPNRFELDVPFCAHPFDHGDCRTDQFLNLWKFPGRGGISQSDMVRYLLHLQWHARLDRPTIPTEWALEAQSVAQSVGMEPGRSVTLFPANSSPFSQMPDIVWATLVARLREQGYKVFCNMKGGNVRPKTMPVAGSTPIEIPVHLALPLVRIAGRTISSPNGMQFLQMLGGQFEQMTVLAPLVSRLGDYEMNARKYVARAMLAQYMYPEVCVGVPFAEYLVPLDASDQELKRCAIAVADRATDDETHVRRLGSAGRSFIDEHREWLEPLIEPLSQPLSEPDAALLPGMSLA